MANYDDAFNLVQEEFDELYNFTTTRLSLFGDRYKHIRKPSKQALNEITEELDFVYIDADHSYHGVRGDLCAWFSKVQDSGIIGGHDYGHPNHPGVKQAVDEFFSRFNWKIHEEGEGVWWVEKRPLNISFIIPAYNCANMIGETIESIINGNLNDGDEVIIVNDCSTDNTLDVIHTYVRKYPIIQVINHKVNKGSAAPGRNTGIEHANNELIFCLDQDNVLAPASIPALKAYLIDQNADAAAFGELRYFTETIEKVTHKWVFQDIVSLSDALAGYLWPGPGGNYLFTRESWLKAGRYYEPSLENRTLDSWTFGIRQLGTGTKMVTLPGTGYCHRYGHQSHYVRNSQKGNSSLSALIGIIPFLDQIEEADINYIFSKVGRLTWMEKLSERPIRIKNQLPGKTGRVDELIANDKRNNVNTQKGLFSILKNFVGRLIKK